MPRRTKTSGEGLLCPRAATHASWPTLPCPSSRYFGPVGLKPPGRKRLWTNPPCLSLGMMAKVIVMVCALFHPPKPPIFLPENFKEYPNIVSFYP